MLEMIRNSEGSAEADVRAARALGYASIGIGLTELVAPGVVLGLLGLEDTRERRGTLGALGVREVMHGVSILTENEPSTQLKASMWARVAGDVLDSALLGVAGMKTKKPLSFAIVATSVAAIGAMDLMVAQRMQRHEPSPGPGGGRGRRRLSSRRGEEAESGTLVDEEIEIMHG